VTRDVIGVRVGLEYTDEPGAVALAEHEHLADVERRVDDDGLA
jgi:hypothetical protein